MVDIARPGPIGRAGPLDTYVPSYISDVGTNTAYLENDPVTGEPLILRTSSGNADLYVYSGTGNPVALLTDFSIETFAYEYDPYGVAVISAGGNGIALQQNPFLFAGGIQDRATGWIKFGVRWYNPTTGRWTQQDTLDNPLDPNNADRYAYVPPQGGFAQCLRLQIEASSPRSVGPISSLAEGKR